MIFICLKYKKEKHFSYHQLICFCFKVGQNLVRLTAWPLVGSDHETCTNCPLPQASVS